MSSGVPTARQLVPALAAAAALAACDDLRPLRPLAIDLRTPPNQAPDRLALAEVDLASHAGLDAFEARWLPRPGAGALADFLEALLAAPERPAAGLGSPLLLQRVAILRADVAAVRGDGLETVIRAGTRLREAAPDAPDTLFVEGYIPWRFLRAVDEPRRPLNLSPELVPFAASVRERWTQLLARKPDYRGPRGRDASWLKAAIAELDAALAARGTAAAAVAPTGSGATLAPPAVTPLDSDRLAAVEALTRFDAAPDGERRSLCGTWREALASPEDAASSPDSAALALRCASLAGDAPLAVSALAGLVALDGAGHDACALRDGLTMRFGEAVISAEMQRLGLTLGCLPR
jgi:hypothetical protein